MFSLKLYFIFFTIITLVSTTSTARDNRFTTPTLQNPSIAQTDQNSTTALMVKENNNNWDDFVKVGTIATASQICKVFSHPFFKSPNQNYQLLDTINGQFRWDGIEASTLWINKKLIVNHHSAHAAGVFYPSGFSNAAILIVDGMGSDLETQSIYYGDKDGVRCVDKAYEWGIGALYSEVTKLIGFTGLNGVDLAGKTMGLAPLGRNLEGKILNIAKYPTKKDFEEANKWLQPEFSKMVKELDGVVESLPGEVIYNWNREDN